MHRIRIFVLLPLILASGSAKEKPKLGPNDIGNSDPGKGVNLYSIEKEIALGKEMAEEVERQARLVRDDVVTEYVNRLGQNLVRNSDAKVPFTIKVIDSDDVNAFALPGGFLFVNSGLVLKAGSEAELAGVMAHEIAHVAARHGTKQATRGELVNFATIPLVFMGGWAGYAAREIVNIAVPMGFLQFTRGMEAQADHLGLEYMYKAGYDPTAFVDFFERVQSMEKKQPGTIAKMFSSHPMTGSRIQAAQKEIQTELQPRPEYLVDTSEFQDVRRHLEEIENRRKSLLGLQAGQPTLRHRPSSDADTSGDDGRPTLKRRD